MGIGKEVADGVLTMANNPEIQKAADGVFGKLFPYLGLEKYAVETYIEEIKKADISPDAKFEAILSLKEKGKKYKNQIKIARKAVEMAHDGTDFSNKSEVKDEILDRFMDAAGFVSDEQLQDIWAQILAGEFEKPGSTPSSMVRILQEITPEYACAFRIICSMKVLFVTLDDNNNIKSLMKKIVVPIMNNKKLFDIGLTIKTINELEAIGLLKTMPGNGYLVTGLEGRILVHAGDNTIGICKYLGNNKENGFPSGELLLTSAGECLARITPA